MISVNGMCQNVRDLGDKFSLENLVAIGNNGKQLQFSLHIIRFWQEKGYKEKKIFFKFDVTKF